MRILKMLQIYRQLCKDASSQCLNFVTRSISQKADAFLKRKSMNPGIGKRLAAVEYVEDEEDLDDLESDFYNVGKSHKQHFEELKRNKEILQLKIVKQKYFKEKQLPSFLTWSDMLQIRYLHNKDPEEWTLEKLSEGYPALPETIAKIIKQKYMKSDSRVEKHNLNVISNWDLFKKREMDIPERLANHLKKFTGRNLNLKPFELPDSMKPKKVNIKLVEGEFSEIIKSYNKTESSHKAIEAQSVTRENKNAKNDCEDTYIIGNIKTNSRHSIPLHELEKNIEHKKKIGVRLSEDESTILADKREISIPVVENKFVELQQINLENNKKVAVLQKKDNHLHLVYPEKITIPKGKYKSGYTYKLNDCYYDSDGTFLYRVPGMG